MSDDDLTTHPSPNALLRSLNLRGNGHLEVIEAEIAGLLETPDGLPDVALLLRGAESTSQYVVPLVRAQDAVSLAKQILRLFEPSALDPESLIHQSLRRIEHRLGTEPLD